MQIRVDRLREALDVLDPVVPGRKPTLAILTNVLLKDGKAIATDLEETVVLDLPEAQGEFLLPHHQVSELLKYVPGDRDLTLDKKGGNLLLAWDGGKASYDVAKPKEFPPVPEVEIEAEATVDGDSLVSALTAVAPYCTSDRSRLALTGVTLYLGEKVAVAGADGYRLAYKELGVAFPLDDKIIVPDKAISLLERLCKKLPRTVPVSDSLVEMVTSQRQIQLALGKKMLVFKVGSATLTSKLVEGTPPDHRRLIPDDTPIKVHFFSSEMERAINRLKDVARNGKSIVRLVWEENTINVSAQSEDKRQVETSLSAMVDTPGKIAISVDYLLSYLSGKDGMVTMGVRSESEPALFRYNGAPLVLIMPMHVDW